MHPILARLPYIRRPFYRIETLRNQLDRARLERAEAIAERDALKVALENALAPRTTEASTRVAGSAGPKSTSPRWCVFCQGPVESWQPYVIETSEFARRIGPNGSNVDRFLCPRCHSTDRERHLRFFLERLNTLGPVKNGAVLHMAPEVRLGEFILSYKPNLYIKGDRHPNHESVQKLDLEKLPFSDQMFDLAICNHVLEHVNDPVAALYELRRVLKPGARLICQTPFATLLARTLEEPLLQSPEDRLFFYLQEDHLRLFGTDIEQIITNAGFVGGLTPHAKILPELDPETFGINEKEPFFDFVRA